MNKATKKSESESETQIKILLVDDNENNLMSMEVALERDVGADPFRAISGDHLLGRPVVPSAFHGARCCRDGLGLQALSTNVWGMERLSARSRKWPSFRHASLPICNIFACNICWLRGSFR